MWYHVGMTPTPAYEIFYGDFIEDSYGVRKVLAVVDDLVFVSDLDVTEIAFFDTKAHIFANYTILPPGPEPL